MRIYVLVKKILDGPELFWAIENGTGGHWIADIDKAKHYPTERAVHISWTAVAKRHNNFAVKEIEMEAKQ